jgi:DnaJ-class molecular chaperone
MFFGEDAPTQASGSRTTGTRQRAGAGPGFDDILSGMGLDGSARGRPAAPPRTVHEAKADITLSEAYHGTTRQVEVDGKRLEITIPLGADTGTRIKLTGKGPAGGDLVVVIKILPDTRFTRRGADLERELPLTLEEALLGGEVRVETLKGGVLLTIPPGTQPGRTFRLKGQGMPRFRATGHGDLLVKTRVVLPTDLSDEATEAARKLFELIDQPDPR